MRACAIIFVGTILLSVLSTECVEEIENRGNILLRVKKEDEYGPYGRSWGKDEEKGDKDEDKSIETTTQADSDEYEESMETTTKLKKPRKPRTTTAPIKTTTSSDEYEESESIETTTKRKKPRTTTRATSEEESVEDFTTEFPEWLRRWFTTPPSRWATGRPTIPRRPFTESPFISREEFSQSVRVECVNGQCIRKTCNGNRCSTENYSE